MLTTRPKRLRQDVCPAGIYIGTIASLEGASDGWRIGWKVRVGRRVYRLPQQVDGEGLLDVVADLGFKEGEMIDPSAAVGRSCKVVVRTFGGKTSAQVVDTEPLEATSK